MRGGCEGGRGPFGGEWEGEGVIREKMGRDSKSFVLANGGHCGYLFPLPPLGSSVLEPNLKYREWKNDISLSSGVPNHINWC